MLFINLLANYGVISGPYFPVFSRNTGKYGPEITPHLNTFHAVRFIDLYFFSDCYRKSRIWYVQESASHPYRGAETVSRSCPVKNAFLKISQNTQKNTFARIFFLIKLQASGLQLYPIETLAQVFSRKFSEIFKKTFFIEHLPWLLLQRS